MTGYVRADTDNSIENGQIANASDLDAEFNAIQTAFSTSSGHRHDGTSAEGAPITVVGPVQDVVVSGAAITPKTNNAYDLGSVTNEWKDLYIDGVANIDTLTADAGTVAGAAITTISNTQTLTGKTINLTNNTLVATSAQLLAALTDETGTGSVVFSTSPTISGAILTGVPTAPTAAADTNTTQIATTAHVFAERSNAATLTNKTLTSPVINTPTINGGNISGITDLAIADGGTGSSTAAGARANLEVTLPNLGVTATAEELNRLDGITATTSALNTAATHYVPSGGIIIWSGAIASVPSGWALCDGVNGTPDLRDRFIVGAGSAYAPGATGGANTVALTEAQMPTHSHFFNQNTNVAGEHSHDLTVVWGSGGDGAFNTGAAYYSDVNRAISMSVNGNHAHNVQGPTDNRGSGEAHENRPPYYALAYIMKL